MNISEYLLQKGISYNTNNIAANIQKKNIRDSQNGTELKNENGLTFKEALGQAVNIGTNKTSGVEFSGHALKRLGSRDFDLNSDTFERLNKGVSIAAQKGGCETLVLIDNTAFVVSVKNNKVITAVAKDEAGGNVFTNIDSTVII